MPTMREWRFTWSGISTQRWAPRRRSWSSWRRAQRWRNCCLRCGGAGRLNAATSMPTYLEFTSVESDKAAALQFLCGRMDVPREETVAVGDGRNDASMIAWAGLGVAIEGSPAEVQAAASRTIPGPGRGGIKELADLLVGS